MDYSPYHVGEFDLTRPETLTVKFIFDELGHRFELNCGLKARVDIDSVSAFELLSPCCAAEIVPALLSQELHPNGFETGDCATCGKEFPVSHGPLALEPGPVNHVYGFTPELREWLVHVLSEYLHPMDAILSTAPLEAVLLAYVDAGAGQSTEFLRRTMSGNVQELYNHPMTEKVRKA